MKGSFLLRRARHRASARRHPVSVSRDLHRRVLVALELLTQLDEQAITLRQLRQDNAARAYESAIDDLLTQARLTT